MKKLMVSVLMGLALSATAVKAVNLELALLIDGSGSISSSGFALQKSGYVTGLNAAMPTNGTVTVGVWQFASSTIQSVFPLTTIASAADLTNLVNAINGMVQIGGGTPLGAAITTAANALVALGNSANPAIRQLIDVSTDGVASDNAVAARNAALAAGVEQINGLLVGAGASNAFVGGVDSFAITVDDFNDFAPAITSKLQREVTGTVPDGGMTYAMLGMALLGLAAMRRKLAA